jgi:hypothetical protein
MKTKTLVIIIMVVLGIALYWLSLPDPEKIETETTPYPRKADPECNTSESFLAENCSEYLGTEIVTREEWAILFPEAEFSLVETRTIENFETNMNGFVQNNFILIRQGQREYKDENFDALLRDNQIIIRRENVELVLRAFAWMTAANYLKNEVHFSAIEEVSFTKGETRHPYNYHLSALVESNQHEELHWYFVVQDNRLQIATYQSPALLKDYFFAP